MSNYDGNVFFGVVRKGNKKSSLRKGDKAGDGTKKVCKSVHFDENNIINTSRQQKVTRSGMILRKTLKKEMHEPKRRIKLSKKYIKDNKIDVPKPAASVNKLSPTKIFIGPADKPIIAKKKKIIRHQIESTQDSSQEIVEALASYKKLKTIEMSDTCAAIAERVIAKFNATDNSAK